jgi:excisionase family DNA binding protein
MMIDEILTHKEVAEYLKLAEKTAYRLAAEGKLPGFKVGGSWRFKQQDVSAWIEDQKNHQKHSKQGRIL